MENMILANPIDIIKQIHGEFDHAVNNIEIFAGDVQIEPTIGNPEHIKVLKEIGLVNNTLVQLNNETEKKNKERLHNYEKNKQLSNNVNDVIGEYKTAFPLNKFIFLPQVLNICEKYDLKIAPIDLFNGDVPSKNIDDINQFLTQLDKFSGNIMPRVDNTTMQPLSSMEINQYHNRYNSRDNSSQLSKYYICAPLSDFDTDNKNIDMVGCEIYHTSIKKPHFKYIKPQRVVIPDPIILKPVFTKGVNILGFLIITAWGDEASDMNVVNEISN